MLPPAAWSANPGPMKAGRPHTRPDQSVELAFVDPEAGDEVGAGAGLVSADLLSPAVAGFAGSVAPVFESAVDSDDGALFDA